MMRRKIISALAALLYLASLPSLAYASGFGGLLNSFQIATAPDATIALTASPINTTALTTYTFSATAIAATGYNLVAVGGNASTRTVNSVTVDGQTGVFLARQASGDGPATTEFWIAPSGGHTSGTITVVWSGGQSRTGIANWSVQNLLSSLASDTAFSTGTTPAATTINVPAGGVIAGAAFAGGATILTHTWAGTLEDFDTNISSRPWSGASVASAAGATGMTVSVTPSGTTSNYGVVWVSLR